MDVSRASRKRTAGQGWLTTLLGIFVLVAGGFGLGLIVGVISEEPELVVGHVAGRSTEVDWTAPGASQAPAAGELPAAGEAPADRDLPAAKEQPPRVAEAGERSAPGAAGSPRAEARGLPPVAAAAPERASRPKGRSASYAIQVGAFAASAAADEVAGRLRAAGYPVAVLAPSSDDRWMVRVGPIGGKAEAEQTARRLKVEQDLPTWVLRESGS